MVWVSCPVVHGVLADAVLRQLASSTFMPGESWFGVLPGSSLPAVRRLSSTTCLAKARIFQVWTMDVDRAASLAILTSLRTPNCSCTATVPLPIYSPAAALRFGSSSLVFNDPDLGYSE
ncbi:uncharacterized protein LOC142767306 [Rhipicephalus microplus]|uniref:uncharacterized protein LOC142767306 n=1 Tax=Rhipicephalus microplus TaxID=6941 RepID=UPI003F6CB944